MWAPTCFLCKCAQPEFVQNDVLFSNYHDKRVQLVNKVFLTVLARLRIGHLCVAIVQLTDNLFKGAHISHSTQIHHAKK